MRPILTLITATVVVTLALSMLSTTCIAQADPGAPAAGTRVYLPLAIGGNGGTTADGQLIADQILGMVNAARAVVACGPLSLNPKLTAAAQGHTDDMVARNYFAHTNPEGQGPGDRATASGYNWSAIAENIAAGQTSTQEVMFGSYGWMNSSGHRTNILNCRYSEIGIGHTYQAGTTYSHYWAQLFGKAMQ